MSRRALPARVAGAVSLALLVLLLGPPSQAAPGKSKAPALDPAAKATLVREVFGAGQDMCRSGQYSLALWCFRHAVDLMPEHPGLWLWGGHALCATGDWAGGQEAFRKCLDLIDQRAKTPPSADAPPTTDDRALAASAWNYLGFVACVQGNAEEANAGFDKAAAADTPIKLVATANKAAIASPGPFTFRVRYAAATTSRRIIRSRGGPGQRPPTTATVTPAAAAGPLTVPLVSMAVLTVDQAVAEAEASAGVEANEALRLVNFALETQPRSSRVHLIRGEVYAQKSWTADAFLELQAALALGQGDERTAAQADLAALQQLHRELPLEPTQLLESPHFRVRFAVPPAQAQSAVKILEAASQHFADSFGVRLPTVMVRLFPTEDTGRAFLAATGAVGAWWSSTGAIPSLDSPAIVSTRLDSEAFAHEYTHLVTHALAMDQPVPSWLDEGLATAFAQGPTTRQADVATLYRQGQLPTPEDMDTLWNSAAGQTDSSAFQVVACYQEARCATSFLLQTFGEETVINWLLLTGRGYPAEQAFALLSGMSYDQFFLQWANRCLR